MRLLIRCLSPMFQLSHANKERASIDAMVKASIDAMDRAMDTRKTTMMNEMNKQIEDLRPSQTQQTEGIQKELRGEIDELKAMMEKYFANTPPPTMQHEGSSGLTELYDEHLSDLISLKQENDSIDIYLQKFDCAMTRLTLPPEHALSIFLTSMNQHLALHVRQFNVTIVTTAARIAKLHELSLHHTPTKPSLFFQPLPGEKITASIQNSTRYKHTSNT
ncbi:hypothetical protein DY000_02015521 [Brassica cretica]|uniref:Retrotransposon gag domain-containing protein n=1 Tax=Brassica cretica TaxID=69181 RepID=A0ABQ7CUS5_BRACR|nr:hypothetical protein DY000_02015521 [Brassica cretica]